MPMRKVGATKTRKRELEFDYEGGRGVGMRERESVARGMGHVQREQQIGNDRQAPTNITTDFLYKKKNRKKKRII